MDTFIITGANAEPAQSVARRLCEMGARVYGIAGTFPETDFAFNEFFPVACDVTSPAAVADEVQKILEREKTVSGLIFSTQYLSCEAFESMPVEEITLSVNALVSAPLVIARLALPSLIASRGSIIVLSPNTVTPRGHVLNNITDAAMKIFAGTLFGELRDTGVKTCHIFLQNNVGTQDPAAAYAKMPQSRIQPDIVAETVETVLRLRENNALTQIVLRPQATRETPHIPVSSEPRIRTLQVVRLPEAKNYPPAEEPVLTPKYRRPDYAPPRGQKALEAAEDAVADAEEFADDYVDPELRYLVKGAPAKENKNPVPANSGEVSPAGNEARTEFDENGNPLRRKRKRRRKKKNRNGAMLVQPPQLANPEPTAMPIPEKRLPENVREKAGEAANDRERTFPQESRERTQPEMQGAPDVLAEKNGSPERSDDARGEQVPEAVPAEKPAKKKNARRPRGAAAKKSDAGKGEKPVVKKTRKPRAAKAKTPETPVAEES